LANQQILTYLTQNKDQYNVEELKAALLGSGYPENEIDEAVNVLSGASNSVMPQNLYDNDANHTLETIHGNISASAQTSSSTPQNNVITQSFTNSLGPAEYPKIPDVNASSSNASVPNAPSVGASGSLGYGNQDLYPSPRSQDQIMTQEAMLDAQRGDKKFGRSIAIGFAIVVFVGLGFFGFQKADGFSLFCGVNLSSDQRQYESSSSGIKIGYPRNWEYVEVGSSKAKMIMFASGSNFSAASAESSKSFPFPIVMVMTSDLKAGDSKDLDKAEAEITASFATAIEGYKLEKKEDIKMGCKKAKQMIFSMSDGKSSGKALLAYTVVGSKAYMLMYGADQLDFEGSRDNVRAMIASFEPTN